MWQYFCKWRPHPSPWLRARPRLSLSPLERAGKEAKDSGPVLFASSWVGRETRFLTATVTPPCHCVSHGVPSLSVLATAEAGFHPLSLALPIPVRWWGPWTSIWYNGGWGPGLKSPFLHRERSPRLLVPSQSITLGPRALSFFRSEGRASLFLGNDFWKSALSQATVQRTEMWSRDFRAPSPWRQARFWLTVFLQVLLLCKVFLLCC